jgi:hypothetical protein
MQSLLSLLPLLLAIAILASMAKLSARIYRRTTLTWLRAFVYVILLMVCTILMGLVSRAGGTNTPLLLAIAAGLAVHLLLGGWYFGRYAYASDGTQLGFPHGALLSLIFVAASFAVFTIPGLIFFAVRP